MQKHFFKFRKVFTNIAISPLILISNNSELAAKFLPNDVEKLVDNLEVNKFKNVLFQGVDIKARRDIGNHIRETSNNRATIVFVAELDEALEIADRVLVMNEKNLVGEHINSNVDINKILVEIAGQSTLGELGR